MLIPGSPPIEVIPAIPSNEEYLEAYVPKTKTPEFMHVLASVGLIMIAYIIFNWLLKTVIGLAPIFAIAGGAGLISHGIYLYHSAKPRQALQWILWSQSCLLIAAAIALVTNRLRL